MSQTWFVHGAPTLSRVIEGYRPYVSASIGRLVVVSFGFCERFSASVFKAAQISTRSKIRVFSSLGIVCQHIQLAPDCSLGMFEDALDAINVAQPPFCDTPVQVYPTRTPTTAKINVKKIPIVVNEFIIYLNERPRFALPSLTLRRLVAKVWTPPASASSIEV